MSNCQGRCMECAYQGEFHTGNLQRPGCAYLLITGHSRVKAAYRRLGVKELTDAVREALKPENCRQFRKGEPLRDDREHRVPVISSDPERARATELRIRAVAAKKKEAERDRILQRKKTAKPERPPTVDPKRARELYGQNMNDSQIAEVLGVGKGSVWYWRKMEGLPPVVQQTPEPPRFGELWKQGLTDAEIAEETGQTKRRVQYWRYKNHLQANQKPSGPSQDLVERRRKMRELYEQGMNDAEIAAAIGVSGKTAAKFRKDNGLPQHMRERQCKIDDERARKLWEQGKTDPEIAEALGVSKGAIWHWRAREGLQCTEYRNRPRRPDWEEIGTRMLKNGATDREIAEAVGRTVSTITGWRVRRGLDYPGRRKKTRHG